MSDTNTPAYRWHVGSNVPGCLPESDIACCESPSEARDALVCDLDRTRDLLADQCDHTTVQPGCEPCDLYATVDALIESLSSTDSTAEDYVDVSGGYEVNVYDGRSLPVAHWVKRFDPTDFNNHTECNPDD